MCARVKKCVEEANLRKKEEGKARRKEKQTATAGTKLAAAAKNLSDVAAFKVCLLHRPGAQNNGSPYPCNPLPCKWLRFEMCGNPACPDPVPKQRNCMKKLCREWRDENNVPLAKFLKPARNPSKKRSRTSAKAPADDDEDSSEEDDELDPETAGLDLIGKKFFISSLLDTHAEGHCLVTEPGTHTDDETGEEFDMLWYKYLCPETDETLGECSRVCEVREWVVAFLRRSIIKL